VRIGNRPQDHAVRSADGTFDEARFRQQLDLVTGLDLATSDRDFAIMPALPFGRARYHRATSGRRRIWSRLAIGRKPT
jgi:hypothetical protein